MKRLIAAALAALTLTTAASAKVVEQSATGFTLQYEAEVAADPKTAYDAFVAIGKWWDKEHTYSGDSANLSIDMRPGGCWCEKLPDGGFVAHKSVAQGIPAKSIMLKGGLGPLAFMAVEGTMVLNFKAQGAGTLVKMTYVIGGHDPKDFKEIAAPVDTVLAEAFKRYTEYAASPKP